ncbi:MAG: DUF4337 domain-containing protein [Candidatus Acidiferrales bacterium]|jgi:hypothetical protein
MHEPAELHESHSSDPQSLRVSLTISILAVVMAGVTLLGHRAHTEEVLLQQRASDQWAFYQAKNIRRHQDEAFANLLNTLQASDASQAHSAAAKYSTEAQRYDKDKDEISGEARKLESERDIERRRADRFDIGEGLLEVAIVLASVTLLTRRRVFWFGGTVLGLAGVLIAAAAWLVH